jgi:hypothetical protein
MIYNRAGHPVQYLNKCMGSLRVGMMENPWNNCPTLFLVSGYYLVIPAFKK